MSKTFISFFIQWQANCHEITVKVFIVEVTGSIDETEITYKEDTDASYYTILQVFILKIIINIAVFS